MVLLFQRPHKHQHLDCVGWQFRPCMVDKESDCSPPQEVFSTSPVDMTQDLWEEATLLCEVTCPCEESPCWFSSSPQCPR